MDSPLRTILDTVLVGTAGSSNDRKLHFQGESGAYCNRIGEGRLREKKVEDYPPEYFNPLSEEFCEMCLARLKRDVLDTYEIYEPHDEGDEDYPELSMGASAD